MEPTQFVALFAEQFDDTPASEFSINTEFRSLEEWSSLTALGVIAMVDEEYDVELSGDDIRNASTIEDVFNLVKSRKEDA